MLRRDVRRRRRAHAARALGPALCTAIACGGSFAAPVAHGGAVTLPVPGASASVLAVDQRGTMYALDGLELSVVIGRSDDAGAHWRTSATNVSPYSVDTIVVGARPGRLYSASRDTSLLVSDDGGRRWAPRWSFERGQRFGRAVAVAETAAGEAVLLAERGTFTSDDGFRTVTRRSRLSTVDGWLVPYGGGAGLLAFVYSDVASLRASQDGGRTWSPRGDPAWCRRPLAPPWPGAPLLCGTGRSSDGGATWSTLAGGVEALAADAGVPGRLWGVPATPTSTPPAVLTSADAGDTWRALQVAITPHVAPVAIGGRLIAQTREGLLSIGADGDVRPIGSLRSAPHLDLVARAGRLVVASPGYGFLASGDRGRTWQRLEPPPVGGEVGAVLRAADGSILLAPRALTSDGGQTFEPLSGDDGDSTAVLPVGTLFVADPADPAHILRIAGQYRGEPAVLAQSRDRGRTWEAQPITRLRRGIRAAVLGGGAAPTLYGMTVAAPNEPRWFRSDDLGRTWFGLELPACTHAIRVQGRTAIAWAAVFGSQTCGARSPGHGGVWRTTDAGETWRRVALANVHVVDIAVSPNGRRLAAAVRDPGAHAVTVLASANGGRSWRRLGKVPDAGRPWTYVADVHVDRVFLDDITGDVYAEGSGGLIRFDPVRR